MLVATKTVESKYLNNQYYHNNYKDVGHKMKQHETLKRKYLLQRNSSIFTLSGRWQSLFWL